MTSSTDSRSSTNRQTYATQRAKLLFGGYRRSDAHDPDTYVLAVAAVLACYDEQIIREATDPRSGISTRGKFQSLMPNSGEMRQFCEELAARRQRMTDYQALPSTRSVAARLPPPDPLTRAPGWRANLFVRAGYPGYERMCERAKGAHCGDWCWVDGGIKIPLDWYTGGP